MPTALPSQIIVRKASNVEIGSFSTMPTKEETNHAREQSLPRMNSANSSTPDLQAPIEHDSGNGSGMITPDPSQDLSEEVQALSNKLIKAINHQSSLEEGLE